MNATPPMENPEIEQPQESGKTPIPFLTGSLKIFLITFVASASIATLFTAWIPAKSFSPLSPSENGKYALPAQTSQAPTPTTGPLNTSKKVGIVSGHWGNDSGSVCSDGYTEAELNLNVASLVQKMLTSYGYTVDLMKEFDPKLKNYNARALVSIHADSCDYINAEATGFKIAPALKNENPVQSAALSACIKKYYSQATGLKEHSYSITPDMSSYHAFGEINPGTPAVIIETGFLNLDKQFLTQHTDLVAKGITDGLLCFLGQESLIETTPDEP